MMDRRNLLAAAGTVPPALLAGCLGRLPFIGFDPVDPPEWPDEPTESAVTSYAARYRVVKMHNRRLDQADDGYYSELSHTIVGAFEAETSAGFVVLTGGGGTSSYSRDPIRSDLVGSGEFPRETLLVNEEGVVQTPLDVEWEDVEGSPPYSTRGLSLVNFAPEKRRVEVSVEGASGNVGETFDLDAKHGRLEPEFLDEPGAYEVTVSVNDEHATHEWNVSDDRREPAELSFTWAYDVALGIYVLPDGTVEIHEVPEERTTERERIEQETIV